MTHSPPPSYASGTSDVPLLGDTIGANLLRTAATHAGRDALVDVAGGRRWTYTELVRDVDGLARALLAAGIERGDRVGIWAPNLPEWVLVQYATARIGAVLVCVNPAYRAHELSYVVRQSGMRTLFSATTHKTSDYRSMVEKVRSDCPDLTDVVYLGDPSWDRYVDRGARHGADDLQQRAAGLDPDQPINIQYTSGTTGFPKGATLTHHNILNNGYFVGHSVGYTHSDRIAVPVPFYHCFGMVMGNLACHDAPCATMVIPGAVASTRRPPSKAVAARTVHLALRGARRCSSPSSGSSDVRRATTCRRLRTGHHGRVVRAPSR